VSHKLMYDRISSIQLPSCLRHHNAVPTGYICCSLCLFALQVIDLHIAVFNGRANQLVCHTGPSTGNVQSTVAYPGFHFGSIYLTKF